MEIYTPERIGQALQLKATTLESMVFLNNGAGSFKAQPLPLLAQLSPGFGVTLDDLDGDGILDCVIAQNFFHPQRETGRMNAGLGALLKGDGAGGFQTIWPRESGLQFRDDARSVVAIGGQGRFEKRLVFGINDGRTRILRQKGLNAQ